MTKARVSAVKFTDTWLEAQRKKKVEREEMTRDVGCRGLYLRLRPNGRPKFVHVFTYAGEQLRPVIGTYPDMTLAQARAGVDVRRSDLDKGLCPESPRAARERERRVAEQTISVETLFNDWHRREIVPVLRDEGKLIKGHFTRHVLPRIGGMSVDKVGRRHVMQVLDAVKDRGSNRVANVLLQNLQRMFRYAQIREIVQQNPADLISRSDAGGDEDSRTRYLTEQELQYLAKRLPDSGLEVTSQAALMVLLGTLVRVGALYAAKWTDIDFKEGLWKAWDQKKKKRQKQYELPLSSFAIRHLQRIQSEQERKGIDTIWVMYSRKNPAEHACAKSLNKQIKDQQEEHKRAKRSTRKALYLPEGAWVVHDLRRTGATHMEMLGVPPDVRRACMNHTPGDRMQQTYDRAGVPIATRREAFERLGRHFAQLLEGSAPA